MQKIQCAFYAELWQMWKIIFGSVRFRWVQTLHYSATMIHNNFRNDRRSVFLCLLWQRKKGNLPVLFAALKQSVSFPPALAFVIAPCLWPQTPWQTPVPAVRFPLLKEPIPPVAPKRRLFWQRSEEVTFTITKENSMRYLIQWCSVNC